MSNRTPTKSVAKLERLSTALDAYNRINLAVERGDVGQFLALIRAQNVLYDYAVDCGMEIGTPDLTGWAAEAVARFLCEA